MSKLTAGSKVVIFPYYVPGYQSLIMPDGSVQLVHEPSGMPRTVPFSRHYSDIEALVRQLRIEIVFSELEPGAPGIKRRMRASATGVVTDAYVE
jgi:hypothetical protein